MTELPQVVTRAGSVLKLEQSYSTLSVGNVVDGFIKIKKKNTIKSTSVISQGFYGSVVLPNASLASSNERIL